MLLFGAVPRHWRMNRADDRDDLIEKLRASCHHSHGALVIIAILLLYYPGSLLEKDFASDLIFGVAPGLQVGLKNCPFLQLQSKITERKIYQKTSFQLHLKNPFTKSVLQLSSSCMYIFFS